MTDAPDIVIWQRIGDGSRNSAPVAWRTIRCCGRGCYHPFSFPSELEVTVSDAYGNYSPHLEARPGDRFVVDALILGRRLYKERRPGNAAAIEVTNRARRGALNVHLLRGGAIVTTLTSVAPEQTGVFAPNDTICVTPVQRALHGAGLTRDVCSMATTEFDLSGIACADIVMTGGSADTDSTALEFEMESVIRY